MTTELFITIIENHTIIKEYEGKISKIGRYCGIEKNKYWLVKNDETKEEYYIIDCGKPDIVMVDKESINKIIEINNAWYYCKNGYIAAKINNKQIYMHAFLMNHIGHGKGQDSVDHIDRNKLNNRLNNLRIVSQSEQNRNTGKRNRKYNACPLPDGITQEELPKYVVYYKDRNHFKVEKHPKQEEGERWSSTKSKKISIRDKLDRAIKHVQFLDSL